MLANRTIKISPLKKTEAEEAERIFRLAFGTFIGLPNPLDFAAGRSLVVVRQRAPHVKAIAAHDGDRLIGSNVVTQWGSFGFFGPLTVLPEYWDRGVAQRLLERTMNVFEDWGVRHSGLYTFAQSPKHIGLYQKFGYWPRYLTALMTHTPEKESVREPLVLLASLKKPQRDAAVAACAKLSGRIEKGLDLTDEIRALLKSKTGDVVLTYTRGNLDGFAVCHTGPGSEGGEEICYIKFAAARSGPGAADRFDKLLEVCDSFAASHGVTIEAGMNLARDDAYRRMRAHGYRVMTQGVAMQRPHAEGFNRPDAYVIDDWR